MQTNIHLVGPERCCYQIISWKWRLHFGLPLLKPCCLFLFVILQPSLSQKMGKVSRVQSQHIKETGYFHWMLYLRCSLKLERLSALFVESRNNEERNLNSSWNWGRVESLSSPSLTSLTQTCAHLSETDQDTYSVFFNSTTVWTVNDIHKSKRFRQILDYHLVNLLRFSDNRAVNDY